MGSLFKEYFCSDIRRYAGKQDNYIRKFHCLLRKAQTVENPIFKKIYSYLFSNHCKKNGIEISYKTIIGKGFYIGHPYAITINPNAVIGENVNIHRGVLIGQENRGKRTGTPIIGNKVWIGINSSIVGKVKIGNNVLIAPNTFVNCDVPDNSIVFGSPCIIKRNEEATKGYINNVNTEDIND